MAKEPTKEYKAFEGMVDQLLEVPKKVLDARVKAHKAASAANPNRRGPKSKVKPSTVSDASPDAS